MKIFKSNLFVHISLFLGMDAEDDDDDEEPSADNPFAQETQEQREAAYIKDPKKTLRGFFEREGKFNP